MLLDYLTTQTLNSLSLIVSNASRSSRARQLSLRALLSIALSLIPGPFLQAQMYGNSYAIVVGVNDYPRESSFSELRYARNDARDFAEFLRSQSFDVYEFYDSEATRTAIISLIKDVLAPRLLKNDRVIFFFAGHGLTEERGGEDYGYIVTFEKTNRSAAYMSMQDLVTISAQMKDAKHQLFILVSCFGGLLGSRGIARVSEPQYIPQLASRSARQVLTAGGRDQIVRDDGGDGRSLFTEALLNGLEQGGADLNGDSFITFSELVAFIQSSASDFGQTPAASVLPGHGGGEFLFLTPASPSPPPSSSVSPAASATQRYVALLVHPAAFREERISIDGEEAVIMERTDTRALIDVSFNQTQQSRAIRLGRTCVYIVTLKTNFSEPIDICQGLPKWEFGGGVSYFTFDPNLPRDLVHHETHPDDRAFLAGPAGTTELDSASISFLNLSLERIIRIGERTDFQLRLGYNLKMPLQSKGRREKQNENDPRPPTEGSFIFTMLEDVEPVHEIGIGVNRDSGRAVNFQIKPMLYLGYWSMALKKGWSRFGSDEEALVSEADGFSVSPQLHVSIGTKRLNGAFSVAFRTIDFQFEQENLGSEVADGWEVQVAIAARLGKSKQR